MLYNVVTSHPSIYISYSVGKDDSVAALCSLSLTMVEAGATTPVTIVMDARDQGRLGDD